MTLNIRLTKRRDLKEKFSTLKMWKAEIWMFLLESCSTANCKFQDKKPCKRMGKIHYKVLVPNI